MFTYVCLGTNNLLKAAIFYDRVLGTLGLNRCDVGAESGFEEMIGWGMYSDDGRQELALWICKPFNGSPATVGNGTMITFKAKSWKQVNDFHEAALKKGGSSEGALACDLITTTIFMLHIFAIWTAINSPPFVEDLKHDQN